MSGRRHCWVFLASIVAVSSVVRADDPPAMPAMSLADALAYAKAHQPDLRVAAARVEAARRQRDISQARWYPTITGTAQLLASTSNNSTADYIGVVGFDNPRVSSTRARSAESSSWQPSASSLLGVGVRQLVYGFGRIADQSAADALRTDAATLSLAGLKLVVDNTIQESYFAVYAAKAVVQASESAVVRAQAHRDEAKAGVDVGLRRPIELTRAQAVLDRYELSRIRARGSVIVAQAVLAAAVGVPDHLLDISSTPPTPADLPPLDTAFDAIAHNPDLKSVMTLVRAQEKQTLAYAAEMHPNLFVSGALSGNAGGGAPTSGDRAELHGFLPVIPNWDVGLILAWPLFDQTVRARVQQSKAEEQVFREQAAVVRIRLGAAIEESYTDVRTAREALPILAHRLQAAIANYDQANARFKAGLGTAIEMADAEDLRTSAEIELAEGTFEVARTRANLGRFMAEGL